MRPTEYLPNGAFVHEKWGDLPDARLVAICDGGYVATLFAQTLARSSSETNQQSYVVTDLSAGSQEYWNRERVEAWDAKQAEKSK